MEDFISKAASGSGSGPRTRSDVRSTRFLTPSGGRPGSPPAFDKGTSVTCRAQRPCQGPAWVWSGRGRCGFYVRVRLTEVLWQRVQPRVTPGGGGRAPNPRQGNLCATVPSSCIINPELLWIRPSHSHLPEEATGMVIEGHLERGVRHRSSQAAVHVQGPRRPCGPGPPSRLGRWLFCCRQVSQGLRRGPHQGSSDDGDPVPRSAIRPGLCGSREPHGPRQPAVLRSASARSVLLPLSHLSALPSHARWPPPPAPPWQSGQARPGTDKRGPERLRPRSERPSGHRYPQS